MAEEHFALTPLACRIWPTMSDCLEGASCCGNSDNRSILQDCDKTAHKSASIEIHAEDYRWNVASSMTNGSLSPDSTRASTSSHPPVIAYVFGLPRRRQISSIVKRSP